MKYFLHDSNAFNDEKITQLFIEFGYEGLGLFYTILEKLALQEKPVLTDVLKHQLKVGKKLNKCWKFMETIELISSNNGETFNKQLLNFSEKYKIKKQKNAERISQWRKNQEDSENVTRNESVRNSPKVKESKVKESKVKEIQIPTFEDFLTYSKTLSIYHSSFDFQIQAKYNSWVEAGWKDGNNKKIVNWKTKLQNTMPYFKKDFTIENGNNSTPKKISSEDWDYGK